MSREVHVRFCEGVGVKFPRATRRVFAIGGTQGGGYPEGGITNEIGITPPIVHRRRKPVVLMPSELENAKVKL
jgi:hypothetical protein